MTANVHTRYCASITDYICHTESTQCHPQRRCTQWYHQYRRRRRRRQVEAPSSTSLRTYRIQAHPEGAHSKSGLMAGYASAKKCNRVWYLRTFQTFQTLQAESPSSGRVFGNQVQLVAAFLTGLSWSPRFSPGSAGRGISHGPQLVAAAFLTVVALLTGCNWWPRYFSRG